ncbi:MAG: beta-lactamase family protein [Candidatus Aminicenantes bacterium]|nr:beta-lactamase family protein [Candidatus Aminicenantes bacterium]
MKKSGRALLTAILLIPAAAAAFSQSLPTGKPEEVGMSSARLDRVHEIIRAAVANKEFPGAVLLVARKGKVVLREAYGLSRLIPEEKPMTPDLIFDLASVSKPVATATSIMILVEQGRIRLWDRVNLYVPEFTAYIREGGIPDEDARLWHLLTHTSGLPPYTDAAEAEKLYGKPCPTETLVKHIAQLRKTDPPGKTFTYSCLGYITLAHILNKVTGQTLAEFAAENIFGPLKMEHTFYNPPVKYRDLCVPTQVVEGSVLQGVVHDPLARLQGGISGNAGLFSTADDLAVFGQMMLEGGEYRGVRILSPLAVERMTEIFPKVSLSGRGLGWDLDSDYATNGGDLFGPLSYGHSGYTGTSLWIDPETGTTVVFLTNRVHPDDKGDVLALRSKVANVVAASIIRK